MKKQQVAGWVLNGLVSAFLIFGSAMGKFTEWDGKEKMFEHLGYDAQTIFQIGLVEVALAILILVPKVDFIAALLLTAYLGVRRRRTCA